MTHRKNGFWNLCFSVIPGAGQMYQGFIKRGVSIMTLFFGWIMVCAFFGIDEALLLAIVIWFFGFFDSLHRNSLTDAERELLKDGFIFIQGNEMEQFSLRGFRIPAAILLIFFGSYSLLQLVIGELIDAGFLFWDNGIVRLVYDRLPKMVFSFVIIFLGIYLIVGRKKEMMDREEKEEENFPWMTQYREENFIEVQSDRSGMEDVIKDDQNHEEESKEAVEEQSDREEEQPEEDKKEDGGEQI
ncbi:MAG TPA: hypothetical protein DDY31_18535 [Lachnospiraceae bacterium]|nr:hypothetical protein [Lachnospiraceae bacterium]